MRCKVLREYMGNSRRVGCCIQNFVDNTVVWAYGVDRSTVRFPHYNFLICSNLVERAGPARRPLDIGRLNHRSSCQPEMQARIAGRLKTAIRPRLKHLRPAPGLYLNFRADSIAIRFRSL